MACIEDAELEEAADALEAAIARIPKSSFSVGREVEDERENIARPSGPAHQELSLSDIFSHSYMPPPPKHSSRWLWVPNSRVFAAPAVGFPANKDEIRRFGSGARKIAPVEVKLVDSRSFAEVAGMDQWGNSRGGAEGMVFRGMVQAGMDLAVTCGEVEVETTGRMTGIGIIISVVLRAERVAPGSMAEALITMMKTGKGVEVSSAGLTSLMTVG